MKHYFVLLNCILILFLCTTGYTEDLQDTTYTIKGIITNYKPKAALYFAMYASQKDFDEKNFYRKLRYLENELPGDTVHFEFTGIRHDNYIIAGYQDINGDGEINMGWFGPTEPYAVYLPNYGIFGPKFSKCKFLVDRDIDSIRIVFK